jgi:hypothetical protein
MKLYLHSPIRRYGVVLKFTFTFSLLKNVISIRIPSWDHWVYITSSEPFVIVYVSFLLDASALIQNSYLWFIFCFSLSFLEYTFWVHILFRRCFALYWELPSITFSLEANFVEGKYLLGSHLLLTAETSTFRRVIMPPPSGSKNKSGKELARNMRQVGGRCLRNLRFDPDDGDGTSFRNISEILPDNNESHTWRQHSSQPQPWRP